MTKSFKAMRIARLREKLEWLLGHADLRGLFNDVAVPAKWSEYTEHQAIADAMHMRADAFTKVLAGERDVTLAELERLHGYLRLDYYGLRPQDLLLPHQEFVDEAERAGWGRPSAAPWLTQVAARADGLLMVEEDQWRDLDRIARLTAAPARQRDLASRPRSGAPHTPFDVGTRVKIALRLERPRSVLLFSMNSRGHLQPVPRHDEGDLLCPMDRQAFALIPDDEDGLSIEPPVGECMLLALVLGEGSEPFPGAPRRCPYLDGAQERWLRDLLERSSRPSWLTRVHRILYRIR